MVELFIRLFNGMGPLGDYAQLHHSGSIPEGHRDSGATLLLAKELLCPSGRKSGEKFSRVALNGAVLASAISTSPQSLALLTWSQTTAGISSGLCVREDLRSSDHVLVAGICHMPSQEVVCFRGSLGLGLLC